MSTEARWAGILRWIFFGIVVRFVVLIVLGLNVRHRERLPQKGPAILAANHNSHLDTLVLMSLLPLRVLGRLRPVAAMDYFFRNRWLAWFATHVIGVVPIKRQRSTPDEDLLAPVAEALERGDIVIFFPEGSRGEPERLAEFKSGIARLAGRFPQVPVTPVFMHGLGKALPRGEWLLVPFFVDVFIGEPLTWNGDRRAYLNEFKCAIERLAAEGHFPPWE
ncbi:MAG: lysophospholipid acyltransferase family protein [Pseudomonadota bacterium]|jgi:1-acyl-sn-glycerol-3-phosphate acyltransferase|nr:MAG: 1-acyl-sn-glycerol-3-phosphate acyltransferase [Pseudomonadota bacterium]